MKFRLKMMHSLLESLLLDLIGLIRVPNAVELLFPPLPLRLTTSLCPWRFYYLFLFIQQIQPSIS